MKKLLAIATTLILGVVAIGVWTYGASSSSNAAVAGTPSITASDAQQLALARAAAAGDGSPTVAMATESLGQATARLGAPRVAGLADPETPVYVATMHGHFVVDAPTPKGAPAPSGSVMRVLIDQTGLMIGLQVGDQ